MEDVKAELVAAMTECRDGMIRADRIAMRGDIGRAVAEKLRAYEVLISRLDEIKLKLEPAP